MSIYINNSEKIFNKIVEKYKLKSYSEGYEIASEIAERLEQCLEQHDITDDFINVFESMFFTGKYKLEDALIEIQDYINRDNGLGMRSLVAPTDKDRENRMLDSLWIGEKNISGTIQNYLLYIVDETINTNAKMHASAGLYSKISRKSSGKCCEWCGNLVGDYRYPDRCPRDVFRRHRHCRCTVLFIPNYGQIQDVHSKKMYDDEKVARASAYRENKDRDRRNDIKDRERKMKQLLKEKKDRQMQHIRDYYDKQNEQ